MILFTLSLLADEDLDLDFLNSLDEVSEIATKTKGYYYSKAIPKDEFTKYLEKNMTKCKN
ncbi:MAG: hypothetical protein U9P38_00800 [Campylobacterota bacterium]|nr:hypothetical protein [Campylobacterota bacterium]